MSTPSTPPQAMSCYRHPDRPTYIRCTRCQRGICPQCMRSAPVGHQCVACVGEGARSIRRPTTELGARLDTKPLLTYVLIAVNVVMYVAQQVSPLVTQQLVMWPLGVAFRGEDYRLFTAGFLHGGLAHIAFNMVALYFTGPALERGLGHLRFLVLYLSSLLGGSVLVYLLTPVATPTLGASGAIFGLFGASFVLARQLRFEVRGIVMLIAVNLVITFVAPGISWQGHVGGLLTGAAVAAVFAYAPRAQRIPIQAGATVVLLAIFAALVWWRTGVILGGALGY